MSRRKWFEERKRVYLLDFQMPDSSDQMPIGQAANLSAVDPADIVRRLHRAGAQAIYVHAKDNQGNCYYDTQYGHKHRGIGGRDLMREFSAACRQVDMTLLYYVQTARERRGGLVASYAARHADGSPVVRTNAAPLTPAREEAPVICLIGPAREYLKNIVRELAQHYDFDGYWLDGFGWFGRTMICYCDTCRELYREDRGAELPAAADRRDEGFRRYFHWRQTMNRRALHEVIGSIRAVNPELTVTHNGSGFQDAADAWFNDCDDYVSREFHYRDGYGGLALWCRMQDAFTPDRPYELETWRFFNTGGQGGAATGDAGAGGAGGSGGATRGTGAGVAAGGVLTGGGGRAAHHMVRAYQVKPVPMLFTEMATITANGGFVQYYDQIRPGGSLDQLSLDRMQAAFAQVRAREPWLPDAAAGARRVHFADLVWSKRSQDFAQERHAQAHLAGLEGVHEALLERHLLHGVVTERRVAEGRAGSPRVLVLPNVVCMSDAVAAGLRRFVQAGGGLVATYRTSLADEFGRPRDNFLLADLFGCDYLEPLAFTYGYVRYDRAGPLTAGLNLGWPMTLYHKLQLKVRARPGAEGHGVIVNPMRGMMMGHPPQEDTPYPAAVSHRFGAGRVVYFPQPLGQAYHDYGHPDFRALLENAVRWAAGEGPPIEVRAPATVEVVLWEHPPAVAADARAAAAGARTADAGAAPVTPGTAGADAADAGTVGAAAPGRVRRLHLINRTPGGPVRTKASVITEEIPVHGLEVRTSFPVRRAVLQPAGEELAVTAAEDGARFTVPRVDVHAVVELS